MGDAITLVTDEARCEVFWPLMCGKNVDGLQRGGDGGCLGTTATDEESGTLISS